VEYFTSFKHIDERGEVVKIFSTPWTETPPWKLEETFYSRSKKGVTRGMHLQIGKSASWRLVSVIQGQIFDVLHDLRNGSRTEKSTISQVMSADAVSSVLIPPGVAHGFQAITDCITLYQSSKHYIAELDTGINLDSINVAWPINTKLMSERDRNLPMHKNWD
jgi:dTDP-4-dehydrorhamnose 3,5-epimerase